MFSPICISVHEGQAVCAGISYVSMKCMGHAVGILNSGGVLTCLNFARYTDTFESE